MIYDTVAKYHLHITFTIQIVHNRQINSREHDGLALPDKEETQEPTEIGYINILANHSSLDQSLNTTAEPPKGTAACGLI